MRRDAFWDIQAAHRYVVERMVGAAVGHIIVPSRERRSLDFLLGRVVDTHELAFNHLADRTPITCIR